jgi:hypothetical protein
VLAGRHCIHGGPFPLRHDCGRPASPPAPCKVMDGDPLGGCNLPIDAYI